ncbi:MAG: C10 family peptidase [Bacteroidales bacterium]|nr:C10 family peptidase [Bacteroidales bacterium]
MKKHLILCLIGLIVGLYAAAAPVGREQARLVATHFVQSNHLKINIESGKGLTDATLSEEHPYFYVFTGTDGKGFVIVSADDRMPPILGYSDENPFSFNDMPENIKSWLQGYEEEILYCRSHNIAGNSPNSAAWKELTSATTSTPKGLSKSGNVQTVGPLISTRWNQSPYYNKYCPWHIARQNSSLTDESTPTQLHTVTGCVATATAQVMKYWNWPPRGRGSNTYTYTYNEALIQGNTITETTTQHQVTLSSHFADTAFDWSSMPDSLTSSSGDSINAVASLMYNVGIALNMDYDVSDFGGSGATTISYSPEVPCVESVLREHFYYAYTITSVLQEDFTTEEWKALLRHELDAARPIIYKGRSATSGHCFICDGYDANDMFHFNWGWGGLCDGYYAIGGLNPSSGGDGANVERDYNLQCGAIIGIQPTTIESDTGNTSILAIANDDTYGTVTGSGTYNNWAAPITLTATPSTGYGFKQWSDGFRNQSRNVIPSGGLQTYTAIFNPLNDYNISYCEPNPNSNYYYNHFSDEWGILLPYELLSRGHILDAVSFKINQGTYRVRVYRGGSKPLATNMVYNSNPIEITSNSQYVTTALPNPITVNEGDSLWITLYSTNGIPCGSSSLNYITNGFWYLSNGVWNVSNNGPFLIYGHFYNPVTVPVNDLAVTNISSSGVTVSWTMPADASPTGYTLAYGVGYVPEQMRKLTVSSTTVSLTGLANNTDYHIFVRADYGNSHSDWVRTDFTTTNATNPVRITASANDETMGFVEGSGIYEQGASVTLQAVPMVGHIFLYWADNNSSTATRTVTADVDATYQAVFERQGYTFMANSNDASLGTVSIEGEQSYIQNGHTYYPFLSTVALTAEPAAGATFVEWSDGNTTNPRYCTVLESNPTYTACFAATAKGRIGLNSQGSQLEITATEAAPISIYDMLGRLVYSNRQPEQQSVRITLPYAGVYLVRVGSSYCEKIIIR